MDLPWRHAEPHTVATLHRGFTLIEMLVVLAILALLLSIAVPRFQGALEKSKDVTLVENLKVLRLTIDQFHADKGRYPDSLQELVEKNYLRAVPVDPITESSTSWILVPSRELEQKGIADVKSGATGLGKDGRPYEAL